ncbi:MAG TPA: aldehyde ferredoxin oxidoreductase N-terminal domain-containing protein [Acidobacteriota bacterium]|nr:aldehyde ferredoxin oxidoreductase N-terminal domain-containing protein [Acidobacteriota bacterium]
MTGGYAGKILRINLTTGQIGIIDTARYEEFGGGYGIGTAIFWDLAVAPGQWDMKNPYDPRNVIPLMVGPLAATGVPGAGRTSVCGLSPETFPTCEFWRGNFGGRFGAAMKLAGWDGVVIEGRAEKPVWINIINDKVKIEDAGELWGLDTWEMQDRITKMVGGRTRFGEEWQQIGNDYTTDRPQIVCIGPAGETRSRLAALITGSGVSARIGGHAAVFGAKNLKAVSVTGTGGIKAADPGGVLKARLHQMQAARAGRRYAPPQAGTASCMPCLRADRRRSNYHGGETMCACQGWYFNLKNPTAADIAAEALIRYGVSSWAMHFHAFSIDIPGAPEFFKGKVPTDSGLGWYLQYLHEQGLLGPGKQIDSSPLSMDQWGELSFRLALLDAIARRAGIGDALAEGCCRAAEKWGRLETDRESGALRLPAWGATSHWTLPWVEWAYAYLFGAGDPTWHGFMAPVGIPDDGTPLEKSLERLSKKTIPYTDDIFMFNYAWKGEEAWRTGIYSPHKAKQLAWSRHYSAFWNESMAFCEMFLPELGGDSPDAELSYYRAVTGKKDSFADTMRIGRKIWTLERAIRVMHGRSRQTEDFFPYMYRPGASGLAIYGGVPIYENGRWRSDPAPDMHLDRRGVDDFKTHYYALEGWDIETGCPTRKTLEELGLKNAADVLGARGRL